MRIELGIFGGDGGKAERLRNSGVLDDDPVLLSIETVELSLTSPVVEDGGQVEMVLTDMSDVRGAILVDGEESDNSTEKEQYRKKGNLSEQGTKDFFPWDTGETEHRGIFSDIMLQ